mmetsp:Transcript_919/g.934  ORF Transcript_919/g.934 Transcript_919/m.934 type:complete len:96 (+) Transcript_919:1422-1709(+)
MTFLEFLEGYARTCETASHPPSQLRQIYLETKSDEDDGSKQAEDQIMSQADREAQPLWTKMENTLDLLLDYGVKPGFKEKFLRPQKDFASGLYFP